MLPDLSNVFSSALSSVPPGKLTFSFHELELIMAAIDNYVGYLDVLDDSSYNHDIDVLKNLGSKLLNYQFS